MLDAVLNAVIDTLKLEGITAFKQFPERKADLKSGVFVCVGAESVREKSSGMGEYLGIRRGFGGAADTELFGRRLELELGFEVFSPFGAGFGAAACAGGAETLRGCIGKFPSGLRALELSCGEILADEELLMFHCRCRLNCTAFLVAESVGDGAEFLDFILKGTVKNGY
ncbi:MAG: hypothetical protein RRY04_01170 [Oscillospiraceae bacterium]